ncbi:MAG: acyl--CoA ligase [Sphingomonadales bacterium]|nr:acyl--CoA ligase [Sphingomonadales bacterium]
MTSAAIDAGDGLPLTLPALWRRNAEVRGDALLLVCDDERLSYAEAEHRSAQIAKGLIAAGAGKGSHVALLLPNGADFVVAMLAVMRIGAVLLPLSTLSTPDEIGWLLANSDSEYLIATPRYRSQDFTAILPQALRGLDLAGDAELRRTDTPWLRRIWFTGEVAGDWSLAALEAMGGATDNDLLAAAEARVFPADRAVIIHTSGSTSRPKGVIHAHGALIRHLDNINRIRGLTPDDILFSPSPWFWVAGFAYCLFGTVVAGAQMVCSNAAEPARVLDVLERERPTMCVGYAPGTQRLADDPSFTGRDLSSMRRGILHPIMPPEVRARDPDLRHSIYGMSEVAGALTMSADESDQPEHRRGSVGTLLPGFEVRIVDPESLEERTAGEVGELWIRSPLMMEGYYGRSRSQVFEPDGWWRSGDLCRIDAEGFFYVAGRLGDMIKTAGANVAPAEVEAVLRKLTGAQQCIVFGLPDATRGEAVVAVVVGGASDEAALQAQAAAKLSRYKVPRSIVGLAESELPLLSSGKVDLPALKRLVQARL